MRRASVCNNAVEDFVRDRHYLQHKTKVSKSRTSINNTWNAQEEQKHQKAKRNVKRDHLQSERFTNIERENVRLLQRMHEIDKRGQAKAVGCPVLAPVKSSVARSASLPPCGAGSRTGARIRELHRIDAENQKFLHRLNGAKSAICLPKLDAAHREQQKFMRMRCAIQKPEWKDLFPPHVMETKEVPSIEPVAPIDLECEDLQRLQDQLRWRAEVEEELERQACDAAANETAAQDGAELSAPRNDDSPLNSEHIEAERFGGKIPASSQALVDELMANDLRDRDRAVQLAEQVKQKEQSDEDAEAAAAEAQDAAAKALLAAQALDYDFDNEMMEYGDVVKSRLNHVWDL